MPRTKIPAHRAPTQSPLALSEPRSLPSTSRPTHPHRVDPAPGQPGSQPTRPPVPQRRAPGPPDLELRSHARRRRPPHPQSPGPWLRDPGDHAPSPQVPWCRGSTPERTTGRSHGRRGPVQSSHKTGSSVVQDASPTVQGVSPLLQDVPATGQKPDPHDAVSRLHRVSDSSCATIKSVIRKTKTRAVRSRGRRCRADRPRSRRRATSITRHTNPSFPTARSALHRARTSSARPITPRFPFTGLALSTHGTRLVPPARRLVRSRGRLVPAEKRLVCSARRSLARRDASSLGETLPRSARRFLTRRSVSRPREVIGHK
jgi:hypothetical protein